MSEKNGLNVQKNVLTLSDDLIEQIKNEVENKRSNVPGNLLNIFFKTEYYNRQQTVRASMMQNKYYEFLRKIAGYLKAYGFSKFVLFVQQNLIPFKEFEYIYNIEDFIQENNELFIQGVYLTLFKRTALNEEVQYWLFKIEKENVSKEDTLARIYFSRNEKPNKIKIKKIFKQFLLSVLHRFKI